MAAQPDYAGKSVLVVDDQELVHKVAEVLLQKLGFSEIDTAFNSSQALKALDKKRYDLILCDVMMQGINGIDFVRTLRQSSNLRYDAGKASTPVLFMSSSSDPQFVHAAKDIGVQGYMLKPFDLTTMQARLEKMFAAPPH